MLEEGADSLGHVGGRLGLERLDVDHAGAELLVGRKLLPELEIVHAAVGELEDDLRGAQIAQGRIEVLEVADRRERAAVEVAEADVDGDLRLDPLDGPVHAVIEARRRARVHPAVRLVDLDEIGAGLDQRAALGVHDPDEIGQQRVLVPIAAPELERHQQGVRPGHRRLDAPGRQRARELELLHDAEPLGRAEPVDHLERRVRVPERLAEPARGGERPDTAEAIVEADDEPDAHHLARAHHVDAGALLVEERHLGRVLHQLADVGRAHAPGLHRLAREPDPPGQPVTSHDRRRQQHHPAPFSRLPARPR